ncbi:DUF167 family protein [Cuniculiplasma sp. SKW3]|uniref:DUF167 family protein n=1 Tax=unclassified Cuniculiplasma TaxID=2619706 RepID=UPI003FD17D12
MIVKVIVKRGEARIVEMEDYLVVQTNVLPQNNMANRDIIKQVSEYYHVKRDQVKIISGLKSKRKTLKIL